MFMVSPFNLFVRQTNKQMKMSEKFLIKIVESFGDVINLLEERKKISISILCVNCE